MLDKGAIYWATAFGAIAAVGVAGAAWRYHGPFFQGNAPVQILSPGPVASIKPQQTVATAPAAADSPKPVPAPVVVAAAPPSPSPQADLPRPQFDIVRVEPTGEAVIAGHAAPKAKVAVTDQGQVVAEADADDAGQFVILPPALAPGAHSLGLTARVGDGAPLQSPGVVGIDVPRPAPRIAAAPANPVASSTPPAKLAPAVRIASAPPPPAASSSPPPAPSPASTPPALAPASRVLEALPQRVASSSPPPALAPPSRALETTPQPAKESIPPAALAPAPVKPVEPIVVAKSDASAPTAPVAAPRIAITGVAADEAGRMVATGAAPPGAFLRLYLNGSLLASVTAGANGLWSLTVEHGMKGGAYAIRADEIDRTKDVVISRAEVPFNYPEHVAELAAVKPPAPAPSAPPPVVAPARQPAVANQQKPIVTETPAVAAPSAAPPPVASVPPTAAVDAPPPAPTPATPASDRAAPAPAPPPPEREAAVAPSTPPPRQEAAAAPSTPPPQTTPAGATPAGAAHAIVRLVDTRRIVPGDNLWTISEQLYGNGLRYTQIYAANAAQIRNPWLIYPGQIFVLPQPTPN